MISNNSLDQKTILAQILSYIDYRDTLFTEPPILELLEATYCIYLVIYNYISTGISVRIWTKNPGYWRAAEIGDKVLWNEEKFHMYVCPSVLRRPSDKL